MTQRRKEKAEPFSEPALTHTCHLAKQGKREVNQRGVLHRGEEKWLREVGGSAAR